MKSRIGSVGVCGAPGAGCLVLGALLVGHVGCSGATDVSTLDGVAAPTEAGTLQVALSAPAGAGSVYHLRKASFEITNPFVNPPIDTIVSGESDTLSVDLPPSAFAFDYTIALQDGWVLNETGADGTERPITATLENGALQSFTIKPARATPLTYAFEVGGTPIATGNGKLAVKVAVDDTLLDDFEDGDGNLVAIGGRNGSWFTFNDGTGEQLPAPEATALPQVVDASANFVLHSTGRNFSPAGTLPDGGFAFGAGVGTTLRVDPKSNAVLPYDASVYDGIRFDYTASVPSDAQLQVSFLVATSATTPVADGGTCTTGCNDDFGISAVRQGLFSFSGGLAWDELHQQGFGTPVAFDPKTIVAIKWILAFPNAGQAASADQFDVQLDNVAFTSSASLPVIAAPAAPVVMSVGSAVTAQPVGTWPEGAASGAELPVSPRSAAVREPR
jgi:hypothetical protein